MAAAPLTFTADANSANILRLVASYGGDIQANINVSDAASTVELTSDKGEKLNGLITACTAIANSSPKAAQLLGSTPEQQAQITEWLLNSVTELSPLLDDKLVKLNDWLASRTLFVGNSITLADLVIYGVVSPAVCGFPVAQHGHFCNLMRWYDYIHATADSTSIFQAVKFDQPKLVPPPPPAPPAAKEKAAAANNDNKKKEEKKGDTKEAAAPTGNEGKDKKKENKEKKKDSAAAAPATPATSATTAASGPTVDALDIRVGVITKVGPHPNADSLYLEEIDLGEDQPRQVISGLRKFVPEDQMQNRRVVVVCNLKPAKMRDVMSYGMVLCASNDDHTSVDPIIPPEGAKIGEKVTFEGYNAEPEAEINTKKKKTFELIAADLVVNDGICTYKGTPFMTSAGPITATINGAHIA